MSVEITSEPLSKLTTFGIGGQTDVIIVSCASQLSKVVRRLAKDGRKVAIVGNGSNILASDKGFDGVVVITKWMMGAEWRIRDGKVIIKADCGVSLQKLAKDAYERGFTGLEWAEGIPATIGGAIVGNAGAFGGYIADVVKSVKTTCGTYSNKKCEFDYRNSIFKRNSEVVLKAELQLKEGDKKKIGEKMCEYAKRRMTAQPTGKSAGSIFKKHIDEGGNIIPAGKLIETAGLKGFKIGGAVISEKHANFIINEDNATAKDVLTLIKTIIVEVERVHGITLEPEIVYLG